MLFGKLQQGVAENQQILTIARLRAEAEDVYGMRLGDIGPATDRINNGFTRDDGASVRKVCTCRITCRGLLTLDRLMMVYELRWKKQQGITEK